MTNRYEIHTTDGNVRALSSLATWEQSARELLASDELRRDPGAVLYVTGEDLEYSAQSCARILLDTTEERWERSYSHLKGERTARELAEERLRNRFDRWEEQVRKDIAAARNAGNYIEAGLLSARLEGFRDAVTAMDVQLMPKTTFLRSPSDEAR